MFLVVWVTCPVHRSLRLLPLPPSLLPNIALWLHEIGDSKPTHPPLYPSTYTHYLRLLSSHIVSPFLCQLASWLCSVIPLPSWQGSRTRPISTRSPSSSLLPSLSLGWVPDLPQPPYQCLHERLRTRDRADPASMPSGPLAPQSFSVAPSVFPSSVARNCTWNLSFGVLHIQNS